MTGNLLLSDLKTKQKVYGIFDGALIPDLWSDIEFMGLVWLPLYRGNYQAIESAIPYVIQLDFTHSQDAYDVSVKLLDELGKNAVLLMLSDNSLPTIVEQCRYFYHIVLPDGTSALRRFFDPRVFDGFLHVLSGANKSRFFSGMEACYSELPGEPFVRKYCWDGDTVSMSLFPIPDQQSQLEGGGALS